LEYPTKGKKYSDHELDIASGGLEHGGERMVIKDSGKNIVLREYDKSMVFI